MAALLCLHHEAINLDLYLFYCHLYTKHLVLVFGNKEAFYIIQEFLAKGHSMTSTTTKASVVNGYVTVVIVEQHYL